MLPKPSFLRFIPLGGLGEVTRNMYVYETREDLVVVDCGIGFPKDPVSEKDLLIPDFSYVIENKEKIRALLLTHGHEDHIGAVSHLLKKVKVPVFGAKLTLGFVKDKLKEEGLLGQANLIEVTPGRKYKAGEVGFEFFRLTHSIPDAMGVSLITPLGRVVHTGDFKLDLTPLDQKYSDLNRLAAYGSGGVLFLACDSLRAEREGYSPSERVVGLTFEREIPKTKGRVIITLFSSDISRIQQAVDVAQKLNRKITIAGRSMEKNVEIARSLGYLRVSKKAIISSKKAKKLHPHQLVILAAGAQGQSDSALYKMATAKHKFFKIEPSDLVLFSSDVIPGNEEAIGKLREKIRERGAGVLALEEAPDIHVSGHAYAQEIKLMITLTRPKFLCPIGSTPSSRQKFGELAEGLGYRKDQIFLLENGEVLDFSKEEGAVLPRVAERLKLEEVVVRQE